MERTVFFGVLAFLFTIALYAPYAKSIIAQSARPTLSSWISWLIMDIAILAAMVAQKAIAWQMVAYALGCGFIICVTLWKGGTLGWKRLDSICVGLVAVAAILWWQSGDPDVAIVVNLAAMIIGSVPLWQNLREDPMREPFLPWCLALAGGIFGVLAIPALSIAGALTPVVFLLLQLYTIALIARRWFPRHALGRP